MQLRDAWAMPITTAMVKPGTSKVYLARTDNEAVASIELVDKGPFAEPSYILIATASPSAALKAATVADDVKSIPAGTPILEAVRQT